MYKLLNFMETTISGGSKKQIYIKLLNDWFSSKRFCFLL